MPAADLEIVARKWRAPFRNVIWRRQHAKLARLRNDLSGHSELKPKAFPFLLTQSVTFTLISGLTRVPWFIA